jgi:hypothetical protein
MADGSISPRRSRPQSLPCARTPYRAARRAPAVHNSPLDGPVTPPLRFCVMETHDRIVRSAAGFSSSAATSLSASWIYAVADRFKGSQSRVARTNPAVDRRDHRLADLVHPAGEPTDESRPGTPWHTMAHHGTLTCTHDNHVEVCMKSRKHITHSGTRP